MNAANVQHNVKLEGRSGQKHQIDVYWEYEKDGKTHRVAIECKNYSRRISLEKVCAFRGVLDDLDDVSGIMVSKIGFQKGAKRYAKEFGISLKELRHPGDGETVIGEIENHFHLEMRYPLFLIDEDWATANNLNLQRYRKHLSSFYIMHAETWRNATHLPLEIKDNIIRDASGKQSPHSKNWKNKFPTIPPMIFRLSSSLTMPISKAAISVLSKSAKSCTFTRLRIKPIPLPWTLEIW